MAFARNYLYLAAQRKLQALQTNVKLRIFYITGHALRTGHYMYWKGLQIQETPLSTYCIVYIKTVFTHIHTHTHTHTHISIGSMKATNYNGSHYVVLIDPCCYPLLSFSLSLPLSLSLSLSLSHVQIIFCPSPVRQTPQCSHHIDVRYICLKQ